MARKRALFSDGLSSNCHIQVISYSCGLQILGPVPSNTPIFLLGARHETEAFDGGPYLCRRWRCNRQRGSRCRSCDPDLHQDHWCFGQPLQRRFGHPRQPDDSVGRGLQEGISERKHPDPGCRLLHRATRADRRHRQPRPDEPQDEGRRAAGLRAEVRLQTDRHPGRRRRPGCVRAQGQPDQRPDHGPGRRHLLLHPPVRWQSRRENLG
ncbi:hypothetical protein D3C76_364390 [compost metagenome]